MSGMACVATAAKKKALSRSNSCRPDNEHKIAMSSLEENPNRAAIPPEKDKDNIRSHLLNAMRSLPEAQAFFEQHLEDVELLQILFELALNDDTDSIRLQSCYCISQYPAYLLDEHEDSLLKLQTEKWEGISDAATTALAKIHSRKGLKYLIDDRIAPKLSWEAKMLNKHLEDFLAD